MRKHSKIMRRFVDTPEGTQVWFRQGDSNSWGSAVYPHWYEDYYYIIDNKHIELMKAKIDNPELVIEMRVDDKPWVGNDNPKWAEDVEYRIRPEWYDNIRNLDLENVEVAVKLRKSIEVMKAKINNPELVIEWYDRHEGWREIVTASWNENCEYRIRPEWYDNLDEPVLCWVSDEDKLPKKKLCRLIIAYYPQTDYPFRDITAEHWKYTTPVKADDLNKEPQDDNR